MSKLVLQLVTWNGVKYVPHLFKSLREQTLQDWDLVVIDNGSRDGTSEALEQELELISQFRTKLRNELRCEFVRNAENRGFAGGHNQAFQESGIRNQESGIEFVQLLNQDTVLSPEYLERVVAAMEAAPDAGAMQGALLRWDFSRAGAPDGGRTDIVDTLGLRVLRNRRVVELGAGEGLSTALPSLPHSLPLPAGGGEKEGVEVFGVSGALPMYRTAALLDVAPQQSAVSGQQSARDEVPKAEGRGLNAEVFDTSFFSYKEDVDLAFRLRSRGWRAFIVPEAHAWHDRTAAGPRELSDQAALDQRRTKSSLVRYHSYKNQLLVLIKNEHPANFLRHWPWICWYELKKLLYVLLFERATARALRDVRRLLPMMRAKRRQVMTGWKVTPAEVRRWFH